MEAGVDSDHARAADLPVPSDPQDVDFRLPDELAEATVLEDLQPDFLTSGARHGLERRRKRTLSRDAPGWRRLPARLRYYAPSYERFADLDLHVTFRSRTGRAD